MDSEMELRSLQLILHLEGNDTGFPIHLCPDRSHPPHCKVKVGGKGRSDLQIK